MNRLRKVNSKEMRKINMRNILKYIVESGPKTRRDIARHFKLSDSVVWNLVRELESNGFIEEKGKIRRGKRKAVLYGASSSFISSVIVNVGIFETHIGVGYLDKRCEVKRVIGTSKDYEEFVKNVKDALKDLMKDLDGISRKTRLVFSVPGVVDHSNAVLAKVFNLGWENVNFRKDFKDLELRVIAENDADLSLEAEFFYSKDVKRKRVSFLIYFGRGLGGALIVDGNLIKGEKFSALEIGHTQIYPSKNSELEDELSITGLIEKVEEVVELEGGTLFEKFESVKRIWRTKPETVMDIIDSFSLKVAFLIKNILYVFNPGIIIIGGIVSNIWSLLKDRVMEILKESVPDFLLSSTEIRDASTTGMPSSMPGCNVVAIKEIISEI